MVVEEVSEPSAPVSVGKQENPGREGSSQTPLSNAASSQHIDLSQIPCEKVSDYIRQNVCVAYRLHCVKLLHTWKGLIDAFYS